MPFVVRGSEGKGEESDWIFSDLGSETTSNGSNKNEPQNPVVKASSNEVLKTNKRGYFAAANKRSRAKKRQEYDELKEKIERLEAENWQFFNTYTNLNRQFNLLKEQTVISPLEKLSYRMENDLLKHEVDNHRELHNGIRMLFQNYETRKNTEGLRLHRQLQFSKSMKKLVADVFNFSYQSQFNPGWTEFHMDPENYGSPDMFPVIKFKCLHNHPKMLQRVDFLNVKGNFKKLKRSVISPNAATKIFSVLKQIKAKFLLEGNDNGVVFEASEVDHDFELSREFPSMLSDQKYTIQTSNLQMKTRHLVLQSKFSQPNGKSLLFESSKDSDWKEDKDCEIVLQTCLDDELSKFLNKVLQSEDNKATIKAEWLATCFTRGDTDDTFNMTYLRQFDDFQNYLDTLIFRNAVSRSDITDPYFLADLAVKETIFLAMAVRLAHVENA